MTSSPGSTPTTRTARSSAAVPLLTAIAYLRPAIFAISCSKRSTRGPQVSQPLLRVSTTSLISSSPMWGRAQGIFSTGLSRMTDLPCGGLMLMLGVRGRRPRVGGVELVAGADSGCSEIPGGVVVLVLCVDALDHQVAAGALDPELFVAAGDGAGRVDGHGSAEAGAPDGDFAAVEGGGGGRGEVLVAAGGGWPAEVEGADEGVDAAGGLIPVDDAAVGDARAEEQRGRGFDGGEGVSAAGELA